MLFEPAAISYRWTRPYGHVLKAGLTFSVEFRRNFGIFFVFAIHREKKFRYFSVYFVSKFKNSKKFVKKSEWLKPTALWLPLRIPR